MDLEHAQREDVKSWGTEGHTGGESSRGQPKGGVDLIGYPFVPSNMARTSTLHKLT